MKLRYARHTHHLEPLITFYCDLLGLQVQGSFNDHAGYDGVFLGRTGENWQLEFTTGPHKPVHNPDADDLLVFYPVTEEEYKTVIDKMEQACIVPVIAKNPYWEANGMTFEDPDGFLVVIAKKV